MSIWTSLSPLSTRVEPGGETAFTLTLRNDGDTVEEYQLAVVGAPAAWSRLEPESIRLFPGAQGTAQLTVRPPRSPEAAAGATPLGVRVRPRQNAELFDVAEGTVTVGEFSDVRAELLPTTVRGRLSSKPRLSVSNFGNAPVNASFIPRDDESALRFAPNPQVLEVWPGRSGASRLKIRPQRLRLFGQSDRYPFAIGVGRQGQLADPLSRVEPRGTYIRLPLFPRWLIVLLSLLLLVALIVIGLMVIPFPNIRSLTQELAVPPVAAAAALPPPPVAPPVVVPPPAAAVAPPTQAAPPPPATTAPPPPPPAATQAAQGQLSKDSNGDSLATITSRQDGNYLTVQNGAQADGTAVVVQSKVNQQNQQVALNQFWVLIGFGDGSMALAPANSGSSVLTRDDNDDNAVIRTVSGGDAAIRQGQVSDKQKWKFTQQDNNTVQIVNVSTGECLTNAGANATVRVLSCQDQFKSLQQWALGDS